MLSPARALLFSDEIETTALAPAGMTVPFAPITAFEICALNLSPILFVLVHTRSPAASEISEPAEIVPIARSVPPGAVVSVLPLSVMRVEGVSVSIGAGGAGRGAGRRVTGCLAGVVARGRAR